MYLTRAYKKHASRARIKWVFITFPYKCGFKRWKTAGMAEYVQLVEQGVVMEKLLESDDIVVDCVDPEHGVVVCHQRSAPYKIGYAYLSTFNPESVAGKSAINWTDLEHGQNVLCALQFPLFAFDITGSHLGLKKNLQLFRVVHLLNDQVISEGEMPTLCTGMTFDKQNRVWTADTAGFLYANTLNPPTVFQQQLPKGPDGKVQQAVALTALPCRADEASGVVAVTQTHVHVLYTTGAEIMSTPLPEDIQEKPPDIHIDIEGTKAGAIPVPSLDEVDHVWQIRCFENCVVVLLQNSVLVKQSHQVQWLHIANLPCIMDAADLDGDGGLALSHMNGDVFIVYANSPDRAPAVLTPRRDVVIGRKVGANSHMLYAKKKDDMYHIYVARPEGMVDGTVYRPVEK